MAKPLRPDLGSIGSEPFTLEQAIEHETHYENYGWEQNVKVLEYVLALEHYVAHLEAVVQDQRENPLAQIHEDEVVHSIDDERG